ncbi:MAG: WbuC family cupin fold metalloprotein [Azonexus sp.]|jgi:cupin fold WbuC family metalloprotein|uniref:WbuC family cupin fold metalloprotein n=1 Tax=Azonexus sp. TaxID=1872668 RepID=UPI0028199D1B|nr:WbuC family cupin fold metalloprotein [Azonexus sp.]MDR0776908.1 WbuC family cupin fold metalloprotein [Azonexus sp.]
MIRYINAALLDDVCAEAKASPRRRKNRNFHTSDDQPGQRLLNAIEPGSYVMPHRHLDPDKSETMVVLCGTLALVIFDDAGAIIDAAKLSANGAMLGVDLPYGTWHTVFALAPDTVFLEAKAGPYCPLAANEKAPWAPAEGDAGAAAYLAKLMQSLPEHDLP